MRELPKPRSPESGAPGGKEQILRAATAVFSEKGFGEARVDEIAERAGVNKAMLYYHVGGKEELYAAVVSAVLDGVQERLEAVITSPSSPEERFRALVKTVGGAAREMPLFPALMLREVADGGKHLPPEVLRKMGAVFGAFRRILDDGRETGDFGAADPLVTHFLVGGSFLFLAASKPLRERLAELQPRAGGRSDVNLPEVVADLLLNGLRGPMPPAPNRPSRRTVRPKGALR